MIARGMDAFEFRLSFALALSIRQLLLAELKCCERGTERRLDKQELGI